MILIVVNYWIRQKKLLFLVGGPFCNQVQNKKGENDDAKSRESDTTFLLSFGTRFWLPKAASVPGLHENTSLRTRLVPLVVRAMEKLL